MTTRYNVNVKLRILVLRKLDKILCIFAHIKIDNNWRRGYSISSYILISVFCKQQSIQHHPHFIIILQNQYDFKNHLPIKYCCQVSRQYMEGNI